MAAYLRGAAVFLAGFLIAYGFYAWSSFHGNQASGLTVSLLFSVSYLAGVVCVCTEKLAIRLGK